MLSKCNTYSFIELITDDVMPELGSAKSKKIKILFRAMESEKLDHSVLHLLTSLIVKYMSSPLTNETEDEPNSAQVCTAQSAYNVLSLSHIFLLFYWSEEECIV